MPTPPVVSGILCNHADPVVQQKRVRAGGNKKVMFTEAWVEFLEKKEAKLAAALLNNQPVGAFLLWAF